MCCHLLLMRELADLSKKTAHRDTYAHTHMHRQINTQKSPFKVLRTKSDHWNISSNHFEQHSQQINKHHGNRNEGQQINLIYANHIFKTKVISLHKWVFFKGMFCLKIQQSVISDPLKNYMLMSQRRGNIDVKCSSAQMDHHNDNRTTRKEDTFKMKITNLPGSLLHSPLGMLDQTG